MIRRLGTVIALALAGAAVAMPLGVQTHFSQGWSPSLVDRAAGLKAAGIRDSVPWASAETKRGIYDFSSAKVAPIRAACSRSIDVMLTLDPSNPLYDGGKMATSRQAQAAFAAYVNALLAALPPCVVAIEIGNEINGGKGLDVMAGADPAATYVSLVNTVAAAVKPRHPRVSLLGGSTNLIGTGFLKGLFRAGLLKAADGIVVHPYRTNAEGVDFEIAHLRATMRLYGKERPIWATEFSDNYDTAEEAAPEQLKMVSLMGTAGVARAYWYALIDQKWFKNMGLIDSSGRDKPAGESFLAIQQRLLPSGTPRRIDTGDGRTYLFRYGDGGYVIWGAPRPIAFTGPAIWRDARGRSIAAPAAIGMAPLIVTGATGYRLGQSQILADSLLEYGGVPWSYFARLGSAPAKAMPYTDTTFDSRFALSAAGPLRLTSVGGSPAGDARQPQRAVLRYTAPTAQQVKVAACFTKPVIGDGADVGVRQGTRILYSGVLTETLRVTDVLATLPAGGTLDFEIGPNRTAGNDSFRAHVQLVAPGAPIVPSCL